MILAIERTKFTYLYKYNQIRVDVNQLIDKSTDTIKGMLPNDLNRLIELFDKAMPLFEQDHEIILLEIDKSKMNIQNGILISFESIQCIYPLTDIGLKLLDGKISEDFILEPPVFEIVIEAIKIKRSMDFRRLAAAKLLEHYDLVQYIKKDTILSIESSVEKNLLDKVKPQIFDTFLDHLIAYNKTPSYIPDGNIEHICKIGVIAIKYLGKAEEVFTNGHFYKSSIKYKSKINSPSYLKSYSDFNSIVDVELKSSIEKMVDIISKEYNGVDVFKVSYFFLAFKSFLNKHDNNIELLNNDIEDLIYDDKQSAAIVLAILGFTYSIESIYEGLHKISNAPLLKSTQSKLNAEVENRKRVESEIEKQKQHEKELENERISMEIQSYTSVNELQTSLTPNISENKIEEIGKTIELDPFDNSEAATLVDLKDSDDLTKNENENTDQQESRPELSEPSTEYQNSKKNELFNNNEIEGTELDKTAEIIATSNEQKDDEINNIVKNPVIPLKKSKKGNLPKTLVKKINASMSNSASPEITPSETDDLVVQNSEDDGSTEFRLSAKEDLEDSVTKSELEQNSPDKRKSITVQVFEDQFLEKFLSRDYNENKLKRELWAEFMDNLFPNKSDVISLRKLKALFTKKYPQDKLFNSKSEFDELKSFFDNFKI
jgi:hypothetical protein